MNTGVKRSWKPLCTLPFLPWLLSLEVTLSTNWKCGWHPCLCVHVLSPLSWLHLSALPDHIRVSEKCESVWDFQLQKPLHAVGKAYWVILVRPWEIGMLRETWAGNAQLRFRGKQGRYHKGHICGGLSSCVIWSRRAQTKSVYHHCLGRGTRNCVSGEIELGIVYYFQQ